MLIQIILFIWFILPINGFNLPGTNPKDYSINDTVPLTTNRISPTSWEDRNGKPGFSLPYDYYKRPFQFCSPKEGIHQIKGNLGSLLFGDRIYNTPFKLKMLSNSSCSLLCTSNWTNQEAGFLTRSIYTGLGYFWNIDDLPLVYDDANELHHNKAFLAGGFPLGKFYVDNQKPMVAIYNHFDFNIEYHEYNPNRYRVVGATVKPSSRFYTTTDIEKCTAEVSLLGVPADLPPALQISFTYSVNWIPSDIRWASRWDKYLEVHDSSIHWIALFNASLLTIILCITIAQIANKSVRKDIHNIRQAQLSNDNIITSGWKPLKNSCLRAPKNTLLLSILVGNGCHLFFLLILTIIFSCLGFLSPQHRGYLATAAIYIYAFSSIIAGFVAAYCFKYFKGDDSIDYESENTIIKTELTLWNTLFILTPTLIPGLVLGSFLILNFLVLFQGSSGAVPFPIILKLIGLWFFVSIPSSIFGSYIAKRGRRNSQNGYQPLDYHKNLKQQAEDIPKLPFYLKPILRTLFGGVLPFFAISIELSYIINSLWLHKIYYMFGFLFVSCIIMIISSITMTIGIIYLMLLAGEYRWQWSSFTISGSVGIYVFFSSLVLLFFRLSNGGLTASLLFLTYSFIISSSIFLITGSIGFLFTWIFIHGIYSAVRID